MVSKPSPFLERGRCPTTVRVSMYSSPTPAATSDNTTLTWFS